MPDVVVVDIVVVDIVVADIVVDADILGFSSHLRFTFDHSKHKFFF